MDGEVASYAETALLDLLEQERDALRRADVDAVLAIAERKVAALRGVDPTGAARLREIAAENHDLIAHLLESLRSVLIAAVTPTGALYGPCGETPAAPAPIQRRYG